MNLTEEDIADLQAGSIGPSMPDTFGGAECDGWESAIDAICKWLLGEHRRQQSLPGGER